MAELPDDDPRIPRRTFSLSEPRTTGMGLQGAWKETLWKTYYSVRSKVTSKSIEIDHSTQAWLLGSCYDVVDSLDGNIEKGKRNVDSTPPHVLSFLTHVYSVIWMTYRVRFQPLPQTTMTTDCGWGCMIRSGQMILANAINIHLLSKDWRLKESSKEHLRAHRKVLSWFREGSDGRTPFSLHKLIEVARHHGNQPGQWFGPAQVAVMIRDIVITSRQEMEEICNFTIVLAHDCTVYKKDVLDQMEREAEERAKKGDNREQAIMLLIPMRLGVDKLNPIYIDNIRFLLSLDQSLGIIGGRPKHSLYFVGYQGMEAWS
jgi:cysteine protease ATG4